MFSSILIFGCATLALASPVSVTKREGQLCTSSNAGSLLCAEDGLSFSTCANEMWVANGPVAAGTMCIDGMIRAAAMPIGSAGSNACVGASSTIPASASAATQAMTNTACDGSAPGSFKCAEDGQSFYQCANAIWYYMGPVAAGTKCSNGAIVPV